LQPDKTYSFRDPTRLTQWVKWLLYALIAISVVAVVSNLMEYRLLTQMRDGAFADAEAEMTAAATANDTRQAVIGVLQFLLFVAAGVAILMWIHRANANARALGATSMRYTPGWSVGWYFIPIANLWKPYGAMKEIWKASANPGNPDAAQRSPLLPWWWGMWITSGILGNAVLRLSLAAEKIDELITLNVVTTLSDALDIPLNLIFLAIINGIYRMQMGQPGALPAAPEKATLSASPASPQQ
jgi:hypothetical protein